jgi:pimeloyl-ACP methyl ester carboxylesterase
MTPPLAFSLLAPLAVLFALLMLRQLLHRSLAPERVPNRQIVALPGWQRLRVATQRGCFLSAWFLPQAGQAPLVIGVHGWGGNADTLLPLAPPLHAAGYGVLLFDTRCHGDSDEDDFASLPRFAEDLQAVLGAVRSENGVDPAHIAVFGHSVGGGAALLAASRCPEIGAVVSLAAFAHPAEMMRRWLTGKGVSSDRVGTWLLAYVQRVIGFRFDDIAPVNTIARSSCPVMLLHGEDDETVPLSDAQRLLNSAGRENVRLYSVPGSHDEFEDIDRHVAVIIAFLESEFAHGMPGACSQ